MWHTEMLQKVQTMRWPTSSRAAVSGFACVTYTGSVQDCGKGTCRHRKVNAEQAPSGRRSLVGQAPPLTGWGNAPPLDTPSPVARWSHSHLLSKRSQNHTIHYLTAFSQYHIHVSKDKRYNESYRFVNSKDLKTFFLLKPTGEEVARLSQSIHSFIIFL